MIKLHILPSHFPTLTHLLVGPPEPLAGPPSSHITGRLAIQIKSSAAQNGHRPAITGPKMHSKLYCNDIKAQKELTGNDGI